MATPSPAGPGQTPEPPMTAYQRFWKRLIYWLRFEDQQDTDVWVKLDTRRLPAGGNHRVGITVGLGGDKPETRKQNVTLRVRVKGPGGEEGEVSTYPEGPGGEKQQRGYFWKTNRPGEYEVYVGFDRSIPGAG